MNRQRRMNALLSPDHFNRTHRSTQSPVLIDVVKDNLKVLNRNTRGKRADELPDPYGSQRSPLDHKIVTNLLKPKVTEKLWEPLNRFSLHR